MAEMSEKVLQSLRKYPEHRILFCSNCGYEGRMGVVKKRKGVTFKIVYSFVVVIPAFILIFFASSYGFSLSFLWGFPLALPYLLVKTNYTCVCPNCDSEWEFKSLN